MSTISASTDLPTRAARGGRLTDIGYVVAGYLVVMAWAMVGAWPMTIVLGVPLLAAALLAGDRPRTAAALAVLPSTAVVVWWAVYVFTTGFQINDPWSEAWFVAAGPLCAVALAVAARHLLLRR